ncbi:MAG TPA: DNA polymerase III subunit gamma/tau [Baekduia sp.]|nr:DNA polymerase III subunit gamma/tau [Baekduia sp.]
MTAGPSLYRRHRPRSFADVVGQEHVVRTLSNAVEQDKVHHAYLFVGSRGTGKTSMAKILAASLNCQTGPTHPTTTPCGTCDSCVSIAAGSSIDVIEMDAASNNSVDDIRDLRESVNFAPVSGGFKVYILDEAHMLSVAAWNAFLKTLEEPPPNTVFVLATTEAAKVMDTVVDRCHRFDFTRPTVEQLSAVVRRVAAQEDITIGADAVALLARHATGSYRDALGTLEQLVTYSGTEISIEDVINVLGVADDDLLFGALDAIAGGQAREAWKVAAALSDSGRDAGQFLRDLEVHARDVLVVQTLGEVPSQLAMTPDRDERLSAQAERCTDTGVVRLIDLLATAQRLAGDGADAQTQLEIALVKAASPGTDPTIKALQARIERLESALAGAPAPTASAPTTPAPETAAPEREAPEPEAPAQPPAPEPRAADTAEAVEEPSLQDLEHAAAEQQTPAPKPLAPGAGLDLALVQELWPAVLAALHERLPMVASSFAGATPVHASEQQITLGFAAGASFQRRKAEAKEAREALAEAFHGLTGVRPALEYTELEPDAERPSAAILTDEELVATLKREFDAQEIQPGTQENN